MGNVGQIHAVQANLRYPDSVRAAVEGADAVVNLVAIAAPSDIQLTMAAVLFCAAFLAFGLAALLGWTKDNAQSLARIEHYLATKEDAGKTES